MTMDSPPPFEPADLKERVHRIWPPEGVKINWEKLPIQPPSTTAARPPEAPPGAPPAPGAQPPKPTSARDARAREIAGCMLALFEREALEDPAVVLAAAQIIRNGMLAGLAAPVTEVRQKVDWGSCREVALVSNERMDELEREYPGLLEGEWSGWPFYCSPDGRTLPRVEL